MRARQSVLAMAFIVAACAGTPDKTTACLQRVAASEVAITESYEATGKLYKDNLISRPVATKSMAATDAANVATESARRLCVLQDPSAGNMLAEAAYLLLDAAKLRGGQK